MDSVAEIKARLPIEQLVSQYCQLQKKGRNLVALCPFHNDTKPSLLVSPDKGIAYCFACQSGGDIFSFYQKIEGVDFPQAIKDLAEKAGVKLETRHVSGGPAKDEKERVRECLQAANAFYQAQLKESPSAQEYLRKRAVPAEQIEQFELGLAPDSFSATYEHLLKSGFSRKEILAAGLGVLRELQEERIYDRFRNRLMFPIHDHQGQIVGFGGRTLGEDDAKYINSSDGILYHKSSVLFGLHQAKEAIRQGNRALLVEGYFDVLACHRIGMHNAVAVSGTALTEQHVKLLKRYAEEVTLCLDQDRAGQEAMERAFVLLSSQGMHVDSVVLTGKDPSETLQADPALLKHLLEAPPEPYLDVVLRQLAQSDLSSPIVKRQALQRLLPLIDALPFAVEKEEYTAKAAATLQTTATALQQDMLRLQSAGFAPVPPSAGQVPASSHPDTFTPAEIALRMFLFSPALLHLLSELIEPDAGTAAALYRALKDLADPGSFEIDALDLPPEHREHVSILWLYGEQHGFGDWSQSMAAREIRRNCIVANREAIRHKKEELTKKLFEARRNGRKQEEALLSNQFEQVLKLARMAG